MFQLEIVTPEKTVYSGRVESLRAPGTEGGFGVLAGHHPMLASLDVGQIMFRPACRAGVGAGREEGEGPKVAATSGGFAQVQRDSVTVLAETAELAGEIDVARAEAARDRARERLARRREAEVDAVRAEMALVRALNRLRVGEQ